MSIFSLVHIEGEQKISAYIEAITGEKWEKKPNIYFILLDALDAEPMSSNLSSENQGSYIDNFTFFNKNTTSFIYTYYSFASFMSDLQLFENQLHKEISMSQKREFLYRILKENGYRITAYTNQDFITGLEDNIHLASKIFNEEQMSSAFIVDFNIFLLSRSLPTVITSNFFHLLKQFFTAKEQLIPTTISDGIEPYTGVKVLERSIADEDDRASHNEFVFLHPFIPHGP